MDEFLDMDLAQLPLEMDQQEYCKFWCRSDGFIHCDDCIYGKDCDVSSCGRYWEFCDRFVVA